MTRSQLSIKCRMPSRTIRYYEEKGIIPSAPKGSNGYRDYNDDYVHRLVFIRNAQKLGFTLTEIKELADMKLSPLYSCEDVHHKAINKINDIDEKIKELNIIKSALEAFSRNCHSGRDANECEFLHFLGNY